jgi:uncharacterized UPF0146 family protein
MAVVPYQAIYHLRPSWEFADVGIEVARAVRLALRAVLRGEAGVAA